MTAGGGRLEGVDLESIAWASEALICIVTDPDGTIVDANPAFVRQARGNPIRNPIGSLVGEGQAFAFAEWLRGLGPSWGTRTWGVLPDEHGLPRDFRLGACRRPDGSIVMIGEQLLLDDVAGALMTVNETMVREHRRVDRERGRLGRMAEEDALTGVANRRAFDLRVVQLVGAATPETVFALVMLDLDHFKLLNDRYGHPVGDAVLRWLGGLMRAAVRRSDFVARYGGEEFVAILRDVDATDAMAWADRLRRAIRAEPPVGVPETVTASLGVAVWRFGDSAADLINRADRALYAAKDGGRDRVGMDPVLAPAAS